MAVTNFTSLLGLALPTTGDLSGTWGTTVNDSITSLLDSAVAGTTTLSTDADVTLSTTNGVANQARQAILLCTGARTAVRTITAPAASKTYVIINATTGGYGVKIVGAGPTTGLTIANNSNAIVVWNGSDFSLASFATSTLSVANGGTGQNSLTANNVLLGNGTSGVQFVAPGANGNLLTSNGTTWVSAPFSGVSSFSAGTTGLTPSTSATGAVTLAGTLSVANGGTGQTTYTNGQLLIGNTTGNTLTKATLTASTNVSITNGAGAITISSCVGSGVNAVSVGPSVTSNAANSVTIGVNALTASGQSNTIAIGNSASTSNSSSIALGANSSATQFGGMAIGDSASASAANSIAFGASASTASANSVAVRLGSTNSIQGYYAFGHASGTAGRYQRTELMLQLNTTSTSSTRLTSDGAAAGSTNQLVLRNNSAFRPGQIDIVAYDTVAGTAAAFEINGVLIKRGASAATTALVGTPTVSTIQSDMAVTPTVTVTADTTNGALAINVASGSANLTRYTAIIRTSEVSTT